MKSRLVLLVMVLAMVSLLVAGCISFPLSNWSSAGELTTIKNTTVVPAVSGGTSPDGEELPPLPPG